jgi:outer membrane immunogenic protein
MRELVLAAATLAFTGTAYAADMPLLKAPTMAAPSWTGFYIGVNGGGVSGHTEAGTAIEPLGTYTPVSGGSISSNNFLAILDAGQNNIHNTGGIAGGQIGYLLQAGSVIGGLEVGMDWMNAKGAASQTGTYVAGTGVPAGAVGQTYTFNQSASSSWLLTVLGRVGFDMGAWYPYATAGVAVASLKYSNNFTDTVPAALGPGSSTFGVTQTKVGVAGGGGVEWRWDSHWSLRGEYLFVSFSDVNGFALVGNPATPGLASVFGQKATFTENIGRAALSYKW